MANFSEFVQVTSNLIPASVPWLNPGMIAPLNPSISFLGVNVSLANIPNKIPLLYNDEITRVWFSVSSMLVTTIPLTPCASEYAGPSKIVLVPSKKYSCLAMSLNHKSPTPSVAGCVLAIVAELTGTNAVPLYTFSFDSDASNQICPLIGAVGAFTFEHFSSILIKFSLSTSPKPL